MPLNWGQGGQGAVGGGLGGAAAGTAIMPGWGTLIGGVGGAVLGGIGGLFSDDPKKQYEEYLRRVQNRGVPQLGPAGQAQFSDFRNNQRGLVSQLEAMAAGRGPSLAEAQLRSATERNIAGQQALAAGATGSQAGIAGFTAANNAQRLGAQAAQDAAAARIAEQQAALQQLGLTLQGARGADESLGRFNVEQGNQFQLANLEAQLRAMGMSDQAIIALLGGAQNTGAGFGEQMLAGGAGAFTQQFTNRAQGQAAQQPNGAGPAYTGGGGFGSPGAPGGRNTGYAPL